MQTILTVSMDSLSPIPVLGLVPLLIGALCAISAVQLGSGAMRGLALASLAAAIGLPSLWFAQNGWMRMAAIATILLAVSQYWLAILDLVGRRRCLRWIVAAPLAWLAGSVGLRLATGSPPTAPDWNLVDTLFALLLDTLLCLLCLAALLGVRRRSLSHRCMLVLIALHPLVSALCAAVLLWPAMLPFRIWTGGALLLIVCVRTILWPGLALITGLDMATRYERRLALRDELSGLLNRRGFFRRAEGMADRTLLLFDIDHFKRINDTLGHAAGDAAIQRFAHVLFQIMGPDAVIGRVGGEEFAAALSGLDRLTIRTRSEQVRTAFADSERALGGNSTVSVGVALAQPLPLGDQMALADRALYRAKQQGRNRTVMSEPLH